MKTSLFDYDLPPSFIAQQPIEPRDHSRLLVYHRTSGQIDHRHFYDIGDYLQSGDLLIGNNSRVIPARLHGRKPTGGKVEVFLLRQLSNDGLTWECLVRGRNLQQDAVVLISPLDGKTEEIEGRIIEVRPTGTRVLTFVAPVNSVGEMPLPPYITEYVGDSERYQTIYAQPEGSAAAPTAGLHFTPERLLALREKGIDFETVTLHVGLDTFRPVKVDEIESHEIHSEWAELSAQTARRINETTLQGGRIVAVGTTSTRTLEWAATSAQGVDPYDTAACPWQRVTAFAGDVDLYIRPNYRFRAVDALITNFHLPKSSLLMLVSAFMAQGAGDDIDVGRRILLDVYEGAKCEGYRFFSFGDAMLIL
ncbi:MAG: tRNA preQ1(34) S-adenosylmethionine ribosyltransferase-isomerase QueA [Chloroflexota bacterium]